MGTSIVLMLVNDIAHMNMHIYVYGHGTRTGQNITSLDMYMYMCAYIYVTGCAYIICIYRKSTVYTSRPLVATLDSCLQHEELWEQGGALTLLVTQVYMPVVLCKLKLFVVQTRIERGVD
jgi:hypothetical protein